MKIFKKTEDEFKGNHEDFQKKRRNISHNFMKISKKPKEHFRNVHEHCQKG